MRLRHIVLLAVLTACGTSVQGQPLRLCGDPERGALYLDADRIWSYNLYEHSRWGAGFSYEFGVRSEELKIKSNIYMGYSPYAKMLSGGVAFEVKSYEWCEPRFGGGGKPSAGRCKFQRLLVAVVVHVEPHERASDGDGRRRVENGEWNVVCRWQRISRMPAVRQRRTAVL